MTGKNAGSLSRSLEFNECQFEHFKGMLSDIEKQQECIESGLDARLGISRRAPIGR